MRRSTERMRRYWDDRARRNAMWYVDTSLRFDDPDEQRFFETGRTIVREALDGAPAEVPRRGLAVEIGSGLGRICRALVDEGFERVVGIDISTEMVRRAAELVPDDRVDFHVGDGTSLRPVDDGSADLVLSFTVFQHIPDPAVIDAYLREAGRVLRPGGLLVFQWNNGPASRRWAARRWLLDRLQRIGLHRERYGRNASEFLGSRVPIARIRGAVEAGGLEVLRTTGEGTLWAWMWARRPDEGPRRGAP